MQITEKIKILRDRRNKAQDRMDNLTSLVDSLQEQIAELEQLKYEIVDHIQSLEQIQLDEIDIISKNSFKKHAGIDTGIDQIPHTSKIMTGMVVPANLEDMQNNQSEFIKQAFHIDKDEDGLSESEYMQNNEGDEVDNS